MKPAEIQEAVSQSAAARRTVDAVEERIRRYASDGDDLADSARNAALEAVAMVLSRQGGAGEAPPWKPPRYPLPADRAGTTKRLLIHDIATGQDVKVYVQANMYPDGRPAEMFVSKQADSSTVGALLDALATAISIGLQHGVPWDTYMWKLLGCGFPPFGWTEERDPNMAYTKSILDYLARWVNRKIEQADTCRKNAKKNCRSEQNDTLNYSSGDGYTSNRSSEGGDICNTE